MRSFTSSSEARFLIALAMTLSVLVASWEVVLRRRAGATVDFQLKSPELTSAAARGEQWVIFGNCLMMTGISPKRLNEQLSSESGPGRDRVVLNIAWHEQSPIAFFEYLRRSGHYPDVIIANVSSWVNGTNFEQEGDLVSKADPLGLAKLHAVSAPQAGRQAYDQGGDLGAGHVQRSVEADLAKGISKRVQSFGHRYHLFDYTLFLGTLATTVDLDAALYQLGTQSWYKVTDSEADGFGYLGLQIRYRDDWKTGLDLMAERSLQRLRLSRLLTPRYWSLLEDHVRHFQSHGTQVVLVRMPEHPKIKAFNDATYEVSAKLRALESSTGTPMLDLSKMGPAEGVSLFDAVHPDAASAAAITREIATWIGSRKVVIETAAARGEARLEPERR